MSDDQAILNDAIARYNARGWTVQQATLTGVQLRHPRGGRQVYLTVDMARNGNLPEIGYSPWQAPLILGVIIIGVLLLCIASRLFM